MNRRGFLKALGIGTAAAAAAAATGAIALLEQELWTPKRTFFLPPVGGWRGNQLLTMSQITNEALRILSQNMKFTTGDIVTFSGVPDQYQRPKAFIVQDAAKHTVNVRRPPRYAMDALNQIVTRWQA